MLNFFFFFAFRLILLGGCLGFLKNMKINGIKPEIKIFTQLLEVIPPTLSAEKVSYIKKSIS